MSVLSHTRWVLATILVLLLVPIRPAGADSAVMTLIHDAVVTWAGWSPDESTLLTTSEDGTARLWDHASGEPVRVYNHGAPVRGAAWDRSGRQFVTWTDAGDITLWSV
ncbi:MAG: hypothetical protein WA009_07440, partial [Phototrophicaceae bacterium]